MHKIYSGPRESFAWAVARIVHERFGLSTMIEPAGERFEVLTPETLDCLLVKDDLDTLIADLDFAMNHVSI